MREEENDRWFEIENIDEVFSPALLVYEKRVKANIAMAIEMAGGADRLCPHVKTHKMPKVMELLIEAGITKMKCATIAEAEVAARSGVPDVLLACQPVGPNIGRLLRLVEALPGTVFSTIADDLEVLRALSAAFHGAGKEIAVLLDIDDGMHRSGIAPGPECVKLYREIKKLPGLVPGGLHVYDGHIRAGDPAQRLVDCELDFAHALDLISELENAMLEVPRLVAGGSPTFPVHAKERIPNLECSPGTFVFWDHGYGTTFPDIEFRPAALVLTRIISKPGNGLVCFDLGHKAIASENPRPHRVHLIGVPDAEIVGHSEEHMVVKTARADDFKAGDAVYGIPWHICPTVALYGEAVVVRDGKAAGRWKVAGRERVLSV